MNCLLNRNTPKLRKRHQLPKLASVISFDNWQILSTLKLPKLKFKHTYLVYPGIQTAQFYYTTLYSNTQSTLAQLRVDSKCGMLLTDWTHIVDAITLSG